MERNFPRCDCISVFEHAYEVYDSDEGYTSAFGVLGNSQMRNTSTYMYIRIKKSD